MPSAAASLSLPERVLLAALSLDEAGQTPFSAEALIVAAWRAAPRVFGMKGYSDLYPCTNRVIAALCGRKGLVRRGWLDQVAAKTYTLSRLGRKELRRVLGASTPPAGESNVTVKLDKPTTAVLIHLTHSRAWELYREGRSGEIVFADALAFLDEKNADVLDRLRRAGNDVLLPFGQVLTLREIRQLGELEEYLRERFAKHIRLAAQKQKVKE